VHNPFSHLKAINKAMLFLCFWLIILFEFPAPHLPIASIHVATESFRLQPAWELPPWQGIKMRFSTGNWSLNYYISSNLPNTVCMCTYKHTQTCSKCCSSLCWISCSGCRCVLALRQVNKGGWDRQDSRASNTSSLSSSDSP